MPNVLQMCWNKIQSHVITDFLKIIISCYVANLSLRRPNLANLPSVSSSSRLTMIYARSFSVKHKVLSFSISASSNSLEKIEVKRRTPKKSPRLWTSWPSPSAGWACRNWTVSFAFPFVDRDETFDVRSARSTWAESLKASMSSSIRRLK